MNVKEKLEVFTRTAMEEAEAKRNEIMSEVEREFNHAVAEAEGKAKRHSDELLMSETYKIQQLKNKEVISASSESKKKLVKRRNELIDELFSDIKNQLYKFVKSPDYKSYLVNEIKKLADKYDDIEVTLMNQDIGINIEMAGIKVKSTSEDFIGGFKSYIPEKHAVIDCSFLSKLEYEQSNFNLLKISF